jgi:radical SAM superfamily enzyme YgiQ (UPF0313 family)
MRKPVALLINPPVYDFALFDLFHKPLGLMNIGRWLADSGYEIAVVDALDYSDADSIAALGRPRRRSNGTGKFFRQIRDFPLQISGLRRRYGRYGIIAESLEARISAVRPDIILITSGMTYWYHGVREAARASRRIWPGVPLAIGGIYASLLPDHCRRTAEPDYVVTGDGWAGLAGALEAEGLPVPDRTHSGHFLEDPGVWRNAGVLRLNEGCPMHCDYCASRLLCPSFKPGDPATALENLAALHDRCGVRSFAFYDDALLHAKEKALIPLLEALVERDMGLSFYVPNAIHLRFLDGTAAGLMKRAGFREMRIGYESSSAEFHTHHDGKISSGELEEGVGILREAGFTGNEIIAYVLSGMPGQHAEEAEDSIRVVSALGIRASVAEYSPVPGTALWNAAVSASRLPIAEEPLFQNNSLLPMEWEGFTGADLKRLKDLSKNLAIDDFGRPGSDPN